jgi:hypothetical protein
MENVINQLRASDFVILKGEKDGRPYEFAKIDGRCTLMNNDTFLNGLKEAGAKIVEVGAKK